MMFNREPTELIDIVPAVVPSDFSAGANNGLWFDMRTAHQVLVVLFKGVGTAGQDPTITLQQATDNAGTGAKALTSITRAKTKQGASLALLTLWSTVTQAAASTFTVASSANQMAIWAVAVKDTDLDINNGFNHMQASVADVGANAQIAALFYVPIGIRYQGQTMVNPLG